MAQLEVPPAATESRPNGRPEPAGQRPVVHIAGDDAVPRGLAVASAVTLRAVIVIGGIVLLALFAKRMMVVVIPVIVALLLATLLAPLAHWLHVRKVPPALASALAVASAFVVFLGPVGPRDPAVRQPGARRGRERPAGRRAGRGRRRAARGQRSRGAGRDPEGARAAQGRTGRRHVAERGDAPRAVGGRRDPDRGPDLLLHQGRDADPRLDRRPVRRAAAPGAARHLRARVERARDLRAGGVPCRDDRRGADRHRAADRRRADRASR